MTSGRAASNHAGDSDQNGPAMTTRRRHRGTRPEPVRPQSAWQRRISKETGVLGPADERRLQLGVAPGTGEVVRAGQRENPARRARRLIHCRHEAGACGPVPHGQLDAVPGGFQGDVSTSYTRIDRQIVMPPPDTLGREAPKPVTR